jgi:hypothetical protein
VKIDVEGSEYEVLKRMEETLKFGDLIIIIEVLHENRAKVLEFCF